MTADKREALSGFLLTLTMMDEFSIKLIAFLKAQQKLLVVFLIIDDRECDLTLRSITDH